MQRTTRSLSHTRRATRRGRPPPSPVSSLPLPVVGLPLRLGRRGLCCARRLDPTFGVGQAFARSSRATGLMLPPPRAASAAPAAATQPWRPRPRLSIL
eukprot:scaffold6937_cov110-Isochrysis_galbana.AAC.4